MSHRAPCLKLATAITALLLLAVDAAGSAPAGDPKATDARRPRKGDVVLRVSGTLDVTYRDYRRIVKRYLPSYEMLPPGPKRDEFTGGETPQEYVFHRAYATPETVRAWFARQDAALAARANECHARAKAGEDWGLLVETYSTDDRLTAQGGKLGPLTITNLPMPLGQAAFTAKVGDILGPVMTVYGYHVTKVLEVRPATATTPDLRVLSDIRIEWNTVPPYDTEAIESLSARIVEVMKGVKVDVLSPWMCREVPTYCARAASSEAQPAPAGGATGAPSAQ